MKKIVLLLFLSPVISLATVLVYLSAGKSLSFSIGTHLVEFPVTLGEGGLSTFRATVALGVTLAKADDGFYVSIDASNPELFSKIKAGFHSRAKSGYTKIAHKGKAEVKWRTLNALEIAFDAPKQAVRVRGDAKVRLQVNGAGSNTDNRSVSAEAGISLVKSGLIRLSPRSLNIKGSPGWADSFLLQRIGSYDVPISPCLDGRNIRIRNLRYAKNSNRVELEIAGALVDYVLLSSCLAISTIE